MCQSGELWARPQPARALLPRSCKTRTFIVMKKSEILGMLLGTAGILLFWVPPIGIALSLAGVVVAGTRLRQKRVYGKFALVLSSFGLLVYVGFWSTVWVVSQ